MGNAIATPPRTAPPTTAEILNRLELECATSTKAGRIIAVTPYELMTLLQLARAALTENPDD